MIIDCSDIHTHTDLLCLCEHVRVHNNDLPDYSETTSETVIYYFQNSIFLYYMCSQIESQRLRRMKHRCPFIIPLASMNPFSSFFLSFFGCFLFYWHSPATGFVCQ